MAGNRGAGGGAASISAAAAAAGAAGSVDTRFPNPPPERHLRKWRGCFRGFSCFGSQKGGKRIVPASRIQEGTASANHGNRSQSVGNSNPNSNLVPSLLAPPSSPASFTNSALPSTAQSPSCFLSISANSPGGPTSTMFATGPYAHETQLVTPPVFSTYTTEPSTAPLTPPPELAYLTTPSSPDVPFARFLSSSVDFKTAGKAKGLSYIPSSYVSGGDLQATYPLYPGSPSSSLISPASATPRTGLSSPFPERETSNSRNWVTSISAHDSPCARSISSKLFGVDSSRSRNFMPSAESSFFIPSTSAQFHLDQAHAVCGGRPSLSREADIFSSSNKHSRSCKQDTEEIEAYRASFGFSADEIIASQNYVAVAEPVDDSFTMAPLANDNPGIERYNFSCPARELTNGKRKNATSQINMQDRGSTVLLNNQFPNNLGNEELHSSIKSTGPKKMNHSEGTTPFCQDDSAAMFMRSPSLHLNNRIRSGQSCSDAEIDYRRARSLRDAKSILAWQKSMQ